MKRIKIMLLSFALLAVVGGALAFKAKFSGYNVCYTTTTDIPDPQKSCPELVGYTITELPHTNTIIYTTPKVVLSTNFVEQCQFEANGTTKLTSCTTPITVTTNQ